MGLRALIVDSDGLSSSARQMLQAAQYKLDVVTHPRNALDILYSNKKYDAIVSDISGHSTTDGFEFAIEARRHLNEQNGSAKKSKIYLWSGQFSNGTNLYPASNDTKLKILHHYGIIDGYSLKHPDRHQAAAMLKDMLTTDFSEFIKKYGIEPNSFSEPELILLSVLFPRLDEEKLP